MQLAIVLYCVAVAGLCLYIAADALRRRDYAAALIMGFLAALDLVVAINIGD